MLDSNIKEAIKKCSRCALCLKNCPIYKIKKDENNTPRGLICKLLGFENKILSEKEIKKDLKICLGCTKCKKNCPARINLSGIFAYKNAYFSPSFLNQKFVLALKLLPIKILYFLNIFKREEIKKEKNQNEILYFKGCVSKAQHKVSFLDVKFQSSNFVCCGLPYLASGDMKSYKKVQKINSELIKKSRNVVFDCASCLSAVREYEELDDIEKGKLIFFSDLLQNKKLTLRENSKYKNKIITLHKPCHLENEDFIKIEEILKTIKDIKYQRLENYEDCCGFGGSYFIFHPIIATKIALKKALDIINIKADLILTVCPSCTIGLRFGQIISHNFKKTLEFRDFIEQEIVIENL